MYTYGIRAFYRRRSYKYLLVSIIWSNALYVAGT